MKPIITIQEWYKGMGKSAFVGFDEMRNVNIHDKPGVVFPTYTLAKNSGTSIAAKVYWMKKFVTSASATKYYCVTSAGKVFDMDIAGTYTEVSGLSSGGGQGLEMWRDYAFNFCNVQVDVIKLSDRTVTTTWDGSTIDGATWHPSLVGQDGILYAGAGRYVYSLEEVSGKTFAPGDNTTFTYTKRALDIPSGHQIKCMAEFGKYLALGCAKTADATSAYVILWDRISSSYNMPIIIHENGVNQILSINNRLYIQAGNMGNWYVSDGSSVKLFARMPLSLFPGLYPSGAVIYPDACCRLNNRILFGITSDASTIPFGIYSLNLDDGSFAIFNTISTGNTADNNSKAITSLLPTGATAVSILAAWQDNTTYGIDLTNTSALYDDYKAYVVSPFYQVADKRNPYTIKGVEVHVAKPLTALSTNVDAVKIEYRTAANGSWTELGIMDTAGSTSEVFGVIPGVVNIQFKFSFAVYTVAPPELLKVLVY